MKFSKKHQLPAMPWSCDRRATDNDFRLQSFVFSLISGLAMALPFLGFYPAWGRHLGWIPFFAITPLAWVLLCAPFPESFWRRVRKSFFLGWIAGVIFFLMTLSWVSSVAWEGLLLLPPFLALYFGLWALFVVMVVRPLFLTKEQPTSLQS